MSTRLKCEFCGAKLAVEGGNAGDELDCPNCGKRLTVPSTLHGGDRLGNYVVQELVGVGSMGEIYRARQVTVDRDVALKVLAPALAHDDEYVRRFLNEVKALARFDHPNIVTAIDAGEENGQLFLVMAYVEGENLQDKVDRDGPLTEREALELCAQVADALGHAWDRHQLLHRDIKPANIMIDPDGNAKLMDMGIAIRRDVATGDTGKNEVIGTPDYMSPEQIRGQRLDQRSDIYSLGATLFFLLTGSKPYAGDNPQAVMTSALTDPIPAAGKRNPEVSEATTALLRRMMSRTAERRPQEWADLARELRKLLREVHRRGGRQAQLQKLAPAANRAVRARATIAQTQAEAGSATRRWLPVVVGVFVLLIVLAVVGAFLFLQYRTRQAEAARLAGEQQEAAAVAAHQEAVATALAEAAAWYKANPNDFAAAIQHYREVLGSFEEPEVEAAVVAAVARIEEARDAACQTLLDDLGKQADALAEAGDYGRAVALLRDYDGGLAAATAADRTKLAGDIERRQQAAIAAAADRRREREAAARQGLLVLLGSVRADLLAGRYGQALENVRGADTRGDLAPVADTIREMASTLADVILLPDAIMATFRGDVDKGPVTVQLEDGRQRILVKELNGGRVKGLRQMAGDGGARIGFEFGYAELAAAEKFRRLGREEDRPRDLLRAVLLLRHDRRDDAVKYLERAGGPIASSFLAELKGGAAAVAATTGGSLGLPAVGLVAYVDADAEVEVGTADRVLAWSGGGTRFTAAGDGAGPSRVAPGADGPAAIHFPGTAACLISDLTPPPDSTVIVAFRSARADGVLLSSAQAGVPDSVDELCLIGGVPGYRGAGAGETAPPVAAVASEPVALDAWHVVSLTRSRTAAALLLAVDGRETMHRNLPVSMPQAGALLRLGSGLTTGPFTGDVGAVVVYNRLLTPAERMPIERQLAERFGVTLPTGEPAAALPDAFKAIAVVDRMQVADLVFTVVDQSQAPGSGDEPANVKYHVVTRNRGAEQTYGSLRVTLCLLHRLPNGARCRLLIRKDTSFFDVPAAATQETDLAMKVPAKVGAPDDYVLMLRDVLGVPIAIRASRPVIAKHAGDLLTLAPGQFLTIE